jgi:hypothetical protein
LTVPGNWLRTLRGIFCHLLQLNLLVLITCPRNILAVVFAVSPLEAIVQEKMYMTEKHAHVRRLLGKEGDMCTRGAYAATSLTNLGDKVRELCHIPNLGNNMYFVL